MNTKNHKGDDGDSFPVPTWLAHHEAPTMAQPSEPDHAAVLKTTLVRFRWELDDWLSSKPELSFLDLHIMPDGECAIEFYYLDTDTSPESPFIRLTIEPGPKEDY